MECNRLFAEDPEETASRPMPPLLGMESPFYNAFGNAMNHYYNNISSNSHLSSSSGSSFFNQNNSNELPHSPNHFINYSDMFDLPDSHHSILNQSQIPVILKKTRSCQNLTANDTNLIETETDRDEKGNISRIAGWLRRYRNGTE